MTMMEPVFLGVGRGHDDDAGTVLITSCGHVLSFAHQLWGEANAHSTTDWHIPRHLHKAKTLSSLGLDFFLDLHY